MFRVSFVIPNPKRTCAKNATSGAHLRESCGIGVRASVLGATGLEWCWPKAREQDVPGAPKPAPRIGFLLGSKRMEITQWKRGRAAAFHGKEVCGEKDGGTSLNDLYTSPIEENYEHASVVVPCRTQEHENQVLYGFDYVRCLQGHKYEIKCLVSADTVSGERLAEENDPILISLDERSIRTWEGDEENQRLVFPTTRSGFVHAMLYLPSKKILLGAAQEMKIKVFSHELKNLGSIELEKRVVFAMAFNDATNELITVQLDSWSTWKWNESKKETWDNKSKLWKSVNLYNLKRRIHVKCNGGWIKGMQHDPSTGRVFIFESFNVVVYDDNNGKLLDSLNNVHTQSITGCLFYPESHYYITSSHDSDIKVWSNSRGNSLVHVFRGHNKAVTRIMIHPASTNDGLVLSCSLDCTVRVQSLNSLSELYRVVLPSPCKSMELLRKFGGEVAVFGGKTIHVLRLNHITDQFAICRSSVKRIEVYHDRGRFTIVSLSMDHTIRLISSSGRTISTVVPENTLLDVIDFSYSPATELIYVLDTNGCINPYNTQVMPAKSVNQDIANAANCLKPNRPTCLALIRSSLHRLGSTSNRDQRQKLSETQDTGPEFLLTGHANGSIMMWNTNTSNGKPCRKLGHAHDSRLIKLHVFRENEMLALTATEELALWDLATLTKLWKHRPKNIINITRTMSCLGVSPTKNVLYCGYSNGESQIFDLATGKPRKNSALQFDHADAVTAVHFYDELHLLITASADGTIRVWDHNKRLIRELVVGHETFRALAVLPRTGDLLIPEGPNISIISARVYLPRLYIAQLHRTISDKPMQDNLAVPFPPKAGDLDESDNSEAEYEEMLAILNLKAKSNSPSRWHNVENTTKPEQNSIEPSTNATGFYEILMTETSQQQQQESKLERIRNEQIQRKRANALLFRYPDCCLDPPPSRMEQFTEDRQSCETINESMTNEKRVWYSKNRGAQSPEEMRQPANTFRPRSRVGRLSEYRTHKTSSERTRRVPSRPETSNHKRVASFRKKMSEHRSSVEDIASLLIVRRASGRFPQRPSSDQGNDVKFHPISP